MYVNYQDFERMNPSLEQTDSDWKQTVEKAERIGATQKAGNGQVLLVNDYQERKEISDGMRIFFTYFKILILIWSLATSFAYVSVCVCICVDCRSGGGYRGGSEK